jgi:hypothetical protein
MLECRANISGFALGGVLLRLWRYRVVCVQDLRAVRQSRCVTRLMSWSR